MRRLLTLTVLGLLCTTTGAGAGKSEQAIFAGGCFWCMETAFEGVPGIESAVPGFTGGTKKNPTYDEVSAGGTGHAESVRVTFDPAKISYAQLLDIFWHNIDPLSAGGQFCDRGSQYRSVRARETGRAGLRAQPVVERCLNGEDPTAWTFPGFEDDDR